MLHASEPNINGAADSGRLYSLASWLRPASYWSVVVCHLPLGLISAVALILPYCVTLNRLPQIPCTFLNLTGYPCPLCGFTRAFWAIATGQWGVAFANSPLSFAVYFAVWTIFLWNATALFSGVVLSRGPSLHLGNGYRRTAVAAVLLLLSANWAYRIISGFDIQ